MIDYLYIYIHPTGNTTELVIHHIENFCNQNIAWEYKSVESDTFSNEIDNIGCIINFKENNLPKAKLAFAKESKRKGVYLANIVPKQKSGFSMDEYNNLALNFFREFKNYSSKKCLNFKFTKKGENITLSDIITGKKTREFFQRYLNHFPTSYHPLDVKRLDTFICALSQFGSSIDYELLNRYLQEELNWDDEDSNWCINRISTGCNILEVKRAFYF